MKKVFFVSAIVLSSLALSSCSSNTAQNQVSKSDVVIENINSRRSIRSYKPTQISKDTLNLILQTAINAPSANNKQPWEVRVIQNPELLEKLNAINKGATHNAPTVIAIACDTSSDSGAFDSGLLTQNILLTAEALDLGTCALATFARVVNSPEAADVLSALNIPEGYEVILGISLGYKDEFPEAKPRDTGKVLVIE